MSPLAWALVLFAVGMLLIVAEMFIPSSGVIGFVSLASIVTSIVMAFRYSQYTGLGFMAAAILGAPLLLALLVKWWPMTPMGRRLLLESPREDEVLPEDDLRRTMKKLVGRVGKAKTLMLPGGPVLIDGQTYDAVSEGMAVPPGESVRVVDVRGWRIVVRPTTDEPQPDVDPNDPLSQPIERLGLEPFEERSGE
jgi:membrane-bound ClpP family serine protease